MILSLISVMLVCVLVTRFRTKYMQVKANKGLKDMITYLVATITSQGTMNTEII